MNPENINFVDSILTIKASGLELEIADDLLLPRGKSIAELLNDQKEKTEQPKNNITK